MPFDTQLKNAFAILDKAGIRRSNYAPYSVRLLWIMGVKVLPPHFAKFRTIAVIYGACFSVLWGGAFLGIPWHNDTHTIVGTVIGAIGAGAVFGAYMAAHYSYERHKYNLPSWESLSR